MQTKRRSMFEVICNTFSGMVCAWLTWQYVIIPATSSMGVDLNTMGFIAIWVVNAVFTVVSIVRGYFWRRTFNHFD